MAGLVNIVIYEVASLPVMGKYMYYTEHAKSRNIYLTRASFAEDNPSTTLQLALQ